MIRTRGFPKKKEKGEEASLGARFLNLRRASSYIYLLISFFPKQDVLMFVACVPNNKQLR